MRKNCNNHLRSIDLPNLNLDHRKILLRQTLDQVLRNKNQLRLMTNNKMLTRMKNKKLQFQESWSYMSLRWSKQVRMTHSEANQLKKKLRSKEEKLNSKKKKILLELHSQNLITAIKSNYNK